MSFTNPIEEIYKCSILKEGGEGGIPKCVYVFYGSVKGIENAPTSKQLTHLYDQYVENGSNSEVFENVDWRTLEAVSKSTSTEPRDNRSRRR